MDKSLGRGTPQPNSNESVTQQSLNKAEIKPKNSAETKLLNEIDPSSLNDEQKAVFEVLTGQKDKIILQGKNLNDLYILERNNRKMCLCTGLLYDPAEHKENEKPVKTDDSTLLKYLKKGLQPIAKAAHHAKLW